ELVYQDIAILKGMEIRVRSFSVFEQEFRQFVDHIRTLRPAVKIASIVNPLPIVGARELWGYWDLMNDLSKEIDFENLKIQPFYDYEFSQARDREVVIDARALRINPLTGYTEGIIEGFDRRNIQNCEIIVDGKNVYGS